MHYNEHTVGIHSTFYGGHPLPRGEITLPRCGMEKGSTLLFAGAAIVMLLTMGLPASGHHVTRTDNRIVEPYGLPVITHIPVLAGYEPVPTPMHCGAGVGGSGSVYSEDFQGAHGYAFVGTPLASGATSLWKTTTWSGPGSDAGHTGSNRLFFGRVGGTYTGSHYAGVAQSPVISVPASSTLALTFDTKWSVEWLKGYDHLWVEALDTSTGRVHLLCTANAIDRGDGSSSGDAHQVGSCSPILTAPCPSNLWLAWETRTINIPSSLQGKDIRLRFTFDSSDNVANLFMGWMVDNVRIGAAV